MVWWPFWGPLIRCDYGVLQPAGSGPFNSGNLIQFMKTSKHTSSFSHYTNISVCYVNIHWRCTDERWTLNCFPVILTLRSKHGQRQYSSVFDLDWVFTARVDCGKTHCTKMLISIIKYLSFFLSLCKQFVLEVTEYGKFYLLIYCVTCENTSWMDYNETTRR